MNLAAFSTVSRTAFTASSGFMNWGAPPGSLGAITFQLVLWPSFITGARTVTVADHSPGGPHDLVSMLPCLGSRETTSPIQDSASRAARSPASSGVTRPSPAR